MSENTKARDKAKTAFQRLRRVEEADDQGMCLCVNGEYRHWKKCDGGHFFSAKINSTCFDSMNVNPQSKRSNLNMGDPVINDGYRKYLIKRYGVKEFQKLEAKSNFYKKWHTFELLAMADEFNKRAEELIKLKKI